MTLIFRQTGGAAMTRPMRAWWPLARFEFYDDKVVLKPFLRKDVEISLEKIEKVNSVRSLLLAFLLVQAIKINYHRHESVILLFSSSSAKKVTELFQQIGIEVE